MRLALKCAFVCLAVAAGLSAAASPAAAGVITGDNPCPGIPNYAWFGDSEATAVQIPDEADPSITYQGIVLRPTDTVAYPGRRPVVVLQHGLGGNRCVQLWIARYLSGIGFVTETHTAPPGGSGGSTSAFFNAVNTTRSAVAFMKSPGNPYAAVTDGEVLALGGHSMGAITSSLLQGEPGLGVDAIVASDSLRASITGDPGAAAFECQGEPSGYVTPLAPALGLAMDAPCSGLPDVSYPELKLAGWTRWRSFGIPSVSLTMKGFEHSDFNVAGGEARNRLVAHYWGAWFRYWLLGEPDQLDAVLTRDLEGAPAESWLSTAYRSAAYLPGIIDTTDFATWLATDPEPDPEPPPPAKPRFSLKLKRLKSGSRAVVFRATVKNRGQARAENLNLRTRVTSRFARKPKNLRIKSLAAGKSTSRTIRIRKKPGFRSGRKLKVTVSVMAGGRARAGATRTIRG